MSHFQISQLTDVEEVTDAPFAYRPVRHHFGISTFGVNAMTGHAVGDCIVRLHDESTWHSSEELYCVISGRARFEIDGEIHDAPAGALVYVEPGVTRTAVAEEPNTTILAVSGAPDGSVYRPTGWEVAMRLRSFFESGALVDGAERGNELLTANPSYGGLYYDTACLEARAGRKADAISHLARAVDLNPGFLHCAPDDEDFASLHGEPEFDRITAPRHTEVESVTAS